MGWGALFMLAAGSVPCRSTPYALGKCSYRTPQVMLLQALTAGASVLAQRHQIPVHHVGKPASAREHWGAC